MWRCIIIFLLILSSCSLSGDEKSKHTLCECAKFNIQQERVPTQPFSSGFAIKVRTQFPEYLDCEQVLYEYNDLTKAEQDEVLMNLIPCMVPELEKYAK